MITPTPGLTVLKAVGTPSNFPEIFYSCSGKHVFGCLSGCEASWDARINSLLGPALQPRLPWR